MRFVNPKRELQRAVAEQAKLPPELLRGRTRLDLLQRCHTDDLIDLKAYFDAASSVVYDELMRRAREEYGDEREHGHDH